MNRCFAILLTIITAGCTTPRTPTIEFTKYHVQTRAAGGTLTIRPKGGEPLLGELESIDGVVRFTPNFPLLEGQTYEAVFRDANLKRFICEHTFPIDAPAPVITAIYPTTDRLPANHLKFYLHFSQPMQHGDITRHFRLIDLTAGKPVPEPFRETELWTDNSRRLTLWFHPGRQKTGVNLNVDLGPVLIAGQQYALEILPTWKSQAGVALEKKMEKRFATLPADRAQPDPPKWKITAPKAGTRQSLRLTFPEPLDAVLMLHLLTVQTARGATISGTIDLAQNETQWIFIPRQNWHAGGHRIRIDWELEDLAGNNLARPFEVNLANPNPPEFAGPRYLKFEVR